MKEEVEGEKEFEDFDDEEFVGFKDEFEDDFEDDDEESRSGVSIEEAGKVAVTRGDISIFFW